MSDDGGDRKKLDSDGFGYPKVNREKLEKKSDGESPIPVVFTPKTFVKLIAWVLGPVLTILLGAISAFFYFYHQTNTHMQDENIHLRRTERSQIETKAEALDERKKLQDDIAEHVDIKVREIKVEQKELVDKAKIELKKQQSYHYNNIITEIREKQ
jgi:hypothetical protein